MAAWHKGKFFIFYMLFLFSSLHGLSDPLDPESCSIQSKLEPVSEKPQISNKMDQQQVLLNKLEELVRNLSEVVARLESKLPDPPIEKDSFIKKTKGGGDDGDDEGDARSSSKGVEEGEFEGKIRDGEKAKGMSVTKFTPFWSERFQFASAVKLDFVVTCMNVLPFKDQEGLSKYVAVCDEKGRVYVFLRNGDVLVEFDTLMESPITAIVSYMSSKTESFVVTGHENGEILINRVWEGVSGGGEDYSSVFMENVGKFVLPENLEDQSPVTLLDVHYIGRMKYILSSDKNGMIKVFKENGSLYGSAMPSSRPLAFLKQRLMFLTENGAGSLDLRDMKIKESECEGLNNSVAQSYVFDAMERSKAYGFTTDGELVYAVLLGDATNFKCRIRYKKKFDMDEPYALQAIKGYLLIVNPEKVLVYNVSAPHYVRVGVPRPVISSSLDELRSSFLNYPTLSLDGESRITPLIASDREKLVIVSLGGGYFGMYHSNLPMHKGEFNTILWTSPVLFFVLFLFGAWQLFAKKKEALTSWGPDDPFSSTSVTSGAPLASSGERSFGDSSSRSSEVMDLRSGNLRPRRYGSPTRYTGGAATSYRLGGASADHNPRPSSVDPDFLAASEMKFRASTMDPPGFPKRRDGMFVGNQIVNDRS